MATSACLFSLGDMLCQKSEAEIKKCKSKSTENKLALSRNAIVTWDKARTARQGMIGGLMLSPGLHFFLTRVMPRVALPAAYSRFANIGLRVGVHQACMMPFIQFTLLFASGALEKSGNMETRLEAGKARFADKWRAGFSASLMYWPLVNTAMYSLVRPAYMNLYADCASLLFASIMSYIMYNGSCTAEVPT